MNYRAGATPQAFELVRTYFDAVCHGTKRADMARAAELVVQVCVDAFKREQSSASKVAALDALFEALQSAPVGVQRVQAGSFITRRNTTGGATYITLRCRCVAVMLLLAWFGLAGLDLTTSRSKSCLPTCA